MPESPTLLSLPRDLFVECLLPYLSISDLASFAKVCSAFLEYVIKYISQLLQNQGDITFLLNVIAIKKTIPNTTQITLDTLLPKLKLEHAKGKAGEFLLSWAYVNRHDALTAQLYKSPHFDQKTGQVTLDNQPFSEEECSMLGLTVGEKFKKETTIEEGLLSDLGNNGRRIPKLMQAQWALCTYQFKTLSGLLTVINEQLPENEIMIFFTLLCDLAEKRNNKSMSAFLEAKKKRFLAEAPEIDPLSFFTKKSAKEEVSCSFAQTTKLIASGPK